MRTVKNWMLQSQNFGNDCILRISKLFHRLFGQTTFHYGRHPLTAPCQQWTHRMKQRFVHNTLALRSIVSLRRLLNTRRFNSFFTHQKSSKSFQRKSSMSEDCNGPILSNYVDYPANSSRYFSHSDWFALFIFALEVAIKLLNSSLFARTTGGLWKFSSGYDSSQKGKHNQHHNHCSLGISDHATLKTYQPMCDCILTY